jgi:hypothetical protein
MVFIGSDHFHWGVVALAGPSAARAVDDEGQINPDTSPGLFGFGENPARKPAIFTSVRLAV